MMTIKMEQPLVSIGLPVYNGEKYLVRALESLLAQDYENIELVISDNASTDSTPVICEKYHREDDRIIFHRRERNFGAIANFSFVLQQARGQYFMWAAADDYWRPTFVSDLIDELEHHPQADVAMCAVERKWEDGTRHDIVRFAGRANPNQMSRWRMLMAIVGKTEYHHYFYGLFRTDFLKSVMAYSIPAVPGGDRIFMCHVAVLTQFRYVDEILHVRTLSEVPRYVRFPGDKFARLEKERLGFVKTWLSLGLLLSRSKLIPLHRKMMIPLAMLGYVRGFWREMIGPFIPFVPLTRRELRILLSRYTR
jgi:glycosyltransferase involved in cell wall biosynthesis